MKGQDSIYRREGEYYLIELRLKNVQQLFNSFDPSPFREQDLDPAAEDYIAGAAADFSLHTPLKLILQLPAHSHTPEQLASLPEAVHNYFDYRRLVMGHQLRQTMAIGRRALLIGLTFLVSCILVQQGIATLGKEGLLWSILEEGVLISGWVAMWHPINLFLYEWWPIRRRERLYQKLAQLPVEVYTPD